MQYVTPAGLSKILAESRDYDELLWVWKGWREQSGKKMKGQFTQLVKLLNKAARQNGTYERSQSN